MNSAHFITFTLLFPYPTGWRACQGLRRTLEIPRSVPGLVTERLLVMSFLGGEQARPTWYQLSILCLPSQRLAAVRRLASRGIVCK